MGVRPGWRRQNNSPENQFDGADNHAKSSSFVFNGGGTFLSKYSGAAEKNGMKYVASTRSHGSSSKQQFTGNSPERFNVQLNNLIVRCRSTDRILEVFEANLQHSNTVNLVTTLHRLASVAASVGKVSLRRDARFKKLVTKLSQVLNSTGGDELQAQDLSNIAWALTKLGHVNNAILDCIAQHVIRAVHSFEPVNISMTLWAFAKAGVQNEALFQVVAKEVKCQLNIFEPQQIANTVWAMAKCSFVDRELFMAAADTAVQKINQFEPMSFSMLVYAFAIAEVKHDELFEVVGTFCTVERLSSPVSSPHVVAKVVLAYATAGYFDEQVFANVAEVSIANLHDFTMLQIATLATSFAKANIADQRLFTAFSDAIVHRSTELKHQEFREICQAFESLGLSTAEMRSVTEASGPKSNMTRKHYDDWHIYVILAVVVLLGILLVAAKMYTVKDRISENEVV